MHEKELRIMKNNLIIFRNALGWSAEYLGNKLGMSKQAISNLENNASQKMSIVQYVALRLIFDYELATGINPVYCTIYQCVWCKNKIINPNKIDTLKSELPKLIKENESNKKKWLEEIENNYFIESNDKFFSNCIDRLTYDSDNSWLTCWLNNNAAEAPFIEENNNYLSSFEELVIRQYIYIYNGTNHSLTYFGCTSIRSDIVKLPSDIKPVFEIPKMKPLGVYPYQPALYTSQTPKNTIYNADIPSDYRHWDCIVVSKRYIDELVEHNLTKNLPIDFLDRLYIVDSVKENNETVGVKRFQKAFDPKSPAEYVNDLSNNLHPSLCSIQNLLDSFNLYPRSLKDRINMLALTNKLPMYIEQRKIEACNLHNN